MEMEIQKNFFEVVKGALKPHVRLVDVVCDVLNVSSDSAYRRIRGEKELTLTEMIKLASYFNISVDGILNRRFNNVMFNYTSMGMKDMSTYPYAADLMAFFDWLAVSQERDMLLTVQDIPLYHFVPFPELCLFNIYARQQVAYSSHSSFSEFLAGVKMNELFEYYNRINDICKMTPTTEVWTSTAIDHVIHLIDYHFDVDCFESKEYPLLMCRQLLSLVDTIEQWVRDGYREYKGKKISYSMYLSPVGMDTNLMIAHRRGSECISSIRLFTINRMYTSDPVFCGEMENWMKDFISKSLLLSGASARERFKYFQALRGKVHKLMGRFLDKEEDAVLAYTE